MYTTWETFGTWKELSIIKIEEEIQDEGIENIFNKVMEKISKIRERDVYSGTNGIQIELE